MNDREYAAYWRGVHGRGGNDLALVCFPDKPPYYNRFFDRIQRYALRRYLRREAGSIAAARLLDVGCGRGRWLRFFREEFGVEGIGIDFSRDAVLACVRGGHQAVAGSVGDIPFRDGAFSLLTSITVLLHLPMSLKERAVAEISRVLSSGGRAVLLEGTWDDPAPHVYGVRLEGWKRLFSDRGMRLVHVSGHYFNFARRSLPGSSPLRDRVAIFLDYPLEFVSMRLAEGRSSASALQHLMVFEK